MDVRVAAITALIGFATVTVLVRTAREVGTVMYTQTVLGVLFLVSPLIALFLGLLGLLPGTSQPGR